MTYLAINRDALLVNSDLVIKGACYGTSRKPLKKNLTEQPKAQCT